MLNEFDENVQKYIRLLLLNNKGRGFHIPIASYIMIGIAIGAALSKLAAANMQKLA